MLPLIDILIILSGISAAQAGPLRRYANITSQASDTTTGVAYQPYAGSPSLSLAPIQGITALPFSQLAESPVEVTITSSPSSFKPIATSTSFATGLVAPGHPPVGSGDTHGAGSSSTTCTSSTSGPPTSFWTFGSSHDGTVAVTSTTWTTVSALPPVLESSSAGASRASQAYNTTTQSGLPKFSFDPLHKSTTPSTAEASTTATTLDTSATDSPQGSETQNPDSTGRFTYPYPFPSSGVATTSAAATDQQSDAAETASAYPSETLSELPKVVTESASQSQQSAPATDASAIPGITIVPQNPSVIYITVTDAGATTTVTA